MRQRFGGVLGRVERITALDFQLVPPLVRIVDAEHFDGRNAALIADHKGIPAASAGSATSAAGTEHTQQVVGSEVLLIDVVGHAEQREPPVVLEQVDTRADVIQFVESVTSVKTTEFGMVEPALRDDIDRFVSLAVVDAAECGLVAQFVEHFDPVDHFGRQVFDGRRNVLPEKFLTVDQHFFNLFALRFDVAAFHFDTRHFFQQFFGRRVRSHFESSRIVHQRVSFLRRAHGQSFDDDFVHLLNVGRHRNRAEVGLRFCDLDLRSVGRKSQVGDRNVVRAVGEFRESESAVLVRRGIEFFRAVGRTAFDDGSDDRLLRRLVDDFSGYAARFGRCRRNRLRKERQCEQQ